jgi:hypothetical protein
LVNQQLVKQQHLHKLLLILITAGIKLGYPAANTSSSSNCSWFGAVKTFNTQYQHVHGGVPTLGNGK